MKIDPLVHDALDPTRSVVVEACAGSGKTWLLVSRILRLLIDGAAPDQILAITFTRKAAQEMQARLNDWLRFLATAPLPDVQDFLQQRALTAAEIETALPRVRRMYELTVSARPGLTINTFHGWFLDLLKHAPLNFGAAGSTALLEKTSPLIEEAWQSLAEQLLDAPNSPPAMALNHLLRDYGLPNTRKLLDHFLHKRADWWIYTQAASDRVDFALAKLSATLDITPDEPILEPVFADELLLEALRQFAMLLAQRDTKTDAAFAQQLQAAMEHPRHEDKFSTLLPVFFTIEGTPRKRELNQSLIKNLGEKSATQFIHLHERLSHRLGEIQNRLIEQKVLRFNRDAWICGEALLAHYQRLKQERGTLDFTDIEWHARSLLLTSDHAAYMQYKLDARYRHILLDEFQDTNPLQWQILQSWFEASVAAERHPTVFLVGDPKQSIYRFRGADARLFDLARDYLMQHFDACHHVQHSSWRSAQPILDTVNRVFTDLGDYPGFAPHHSRQAHLSGQVWLLPLDNPPEQPAAASAVLRNPLLTPRSEASLGAHQLEAARIAEGIRSIVGQWVVYDKDARCQRPAQYRDIMLLARMRTHLHLYETALKAAGIPFRTARHGGLLDTLEVRDITALLEFLVLPYADLKLAQVLRSPLFNASDDDLLALAQHSEGSWWARLGRLKEQHASLPTLARAHALLSHWRRAVDRLPVHDLLDRIYHEGEVLARYRCGVPDALCESVEANLVQFLELTLTLDGGRYPSLPKFIDELAVLRRARDEETPDEGEVSSGGNAVHIHTVHGAKGLERPVVWILDTNRTPPPKDAYGGLIDWAEGAAQPTHFSMVATRAERGRARHIQFEHEAALQAREELNLLYVALTRAQQYLIMSGTASRASARPSWYARLQAILTPDVLHPPPAAILEAAPSPGPDPVAHESDPPLLQNAPQCGQRSRTFETRAMQLGTLLHRLLERIAPPAFPPQRDALQLEFGLPSDDFDALWGDAQRILSAPELARFFDPSQFERAWNEVPFVNAAGDILRIDRMVALPNELWILDYKSSAEVDHRTLRQAAQPYLGQVRHYMAAMQHLFPQRTVRGALIFKLGLWVEVDG